MLARRAAAAAAPALRAGASAARLAPRLLAAAPRRYMAVPAPGAPADQVFAAVDKNGDGRLDHSEVAEFLKENPAWQEYLGATNAETMLGQVSTQWSKRSTSKFLCPRQTINPALFRQYIQGKGDLATLKAAFKRYDGDNSGALDAVELQACLDDISTEDRTWFQDIDTAPELLAKLDADKNGTVELQEWLSRLPRGTKIRIVSKMATETSH